MQILTKLIGHLQTHYSLKQKLETGLCCFIAKDHKVGLILEIFEPANVNDRFIYNCGSKFDVDSIKELFTFESDLKNAHTENLLILISGYRTAFFNCTNLKLLTTISGCLVKRQKKGGQSAVRFSRIAEESRHAYIQKISDELKKLKLS